MFFVFWSSFFLTYVSILSRSSTSKNARASTYLFYLCVCVCVCVCVKVISKYNWKRMRPVKPNSSNLKTQVKDSSGAVKLEAP